MTNMERFDKWNVALEEQGFQPIFDGDFDAAFDFWQSFTDAVMAYSNSVINKEIGRIFKDSSKEKSAQEQYKELTQEQYEELTEEEKIAEKAVAKAIIDMNRVLRAYGIEPMDIDVDDPVEVSDFVEEFCNESMQRGMEMLREMDDTDS